MHLAPSFKIFGKIVLKNGLNEISRNPPPMLKYWLVPENSKISMAEFSSNRSESCPENLPTTVKPESS